MKYLRYSGEFLSISGATWRAEIWQEADSAFSAVGPLTFDADGPLTIEWGEKDKHEVLCSSSATLKIVSPSDRTYEDLYSIEVGRVRLDVYRNDVLYWSGCMDTEFYEEPYEMLNGYTVTLAFSDFGVLDRLKYNLSGLYTLQDLVKHCIARCGINCIGIDESFISISFSLADKPLHLSDIKVRSDNFYDEDGEASSLKDVIDGILQPLALRVMQRAGKVYVYDLNGLYRKSTHENITWDGDSQTMGVDSVYNNAKVTWSPYAQTGNLYPEVCWGDTKTDANLTNINNLDGAQSGKSLYYSYHYSTDISEWIDATDCGFTFWVSADGKNATLGDKVNFFKIVPQYDGTECEGIAIYWRSVKGYRVDNGDGSWHGEYASQPLGQHLLPGSTTKIGPMLFRTDPIWLPSVPDSNALLLRVAFDMLMDPRFNPHESAADLVNGSGLVNEAQKVIYDEFTHYGNFIYVPIIIKFKPDDSDKVYVWDNRSVVNKPNTDPVTTLNGTYGKWVEYNNNDKVPNAWGYLCYYDAKDHVDTSGVLGWKKNRSAINPHDKNTISILTNAEDGQYLPYPSIDGQGGTLSIEVRGEGWVIANENQDMLTASQYDIKSLWSKIYWVLMKLPEIEIVNATQFDKELDTDDVEYNGQLNAAAKEAIEIDTICGTCVDGVPTARGAYFNAKSGKQITEFCRASRVSQAEDLLIGTLYSQYAKRRTKLSGEAQILDTPLTIYHEANQALKSFIATADTQDVRMDCSDATFVELRPDEYTSNKE